MHLRHIRNFGALLLCLAITPQILPGQQIAIPRIEQMPAFPSPYLMREWKRVAGGYDSLAFDIARSGQYLPLLFLNSSTVNYPSQLSFGLHTFVGDSRSGAQGEAINVLPALVGAALVGTDKRNQFGRDWVLMSREFFNNRPEENVYLNSPVTTSGSDWWYDVMPSIFFYQLYSRYPGTNDYPRQFTSVADRWLQAMYAMGGSLTPWSHPGLEHRGWILSSMSPNNQIPHEPEAGGGIGWLLYHASLVSGRAEYRSAAELYLEELNAYTTNPAYELQLSYGTVAAARMNAEVGTSFDVEKMVNWCFNVSPIRSWGAIVGKWGGIDCSGLIGEVNGSNDYAFAMNTFEQVGALVPLVRYDPRFARAIGRWVLNAANASRLFYGNYLPDANQDSRAWSRQYDSMSVIAHEALRQSGPGGAAPYATGDAIGGGWAPTNLSLYSSSHVGILGAIIDTTDVPGILKLDLLATDYFHAPAYPSFLFYNPDTVARSVQIPVGIGTHDIYDAATKQFLLSGVQGSAQLVIPARDAVVAVLVPSAGILSYDEEKMLVDGVVVDFHSGNVPLNHRPRIRGLGAAPPLLYLSGETRLYSTATDRDGDTLDYSWAAGAGVFTGVGPMVTWTAPAAKGNVIITCTVSDRKGGSDTAAVTIAVVDSALSVPVIQSIFARPGKVDLGASSTVTCRAFDGKGLPLTFFWESDGGTISGSDSAIQWTAPSQSGNWKIRCTVRNTQGGSATDSLLILVRDFSQGGTGGPILSIPFTGTIVDVSGYGNQITPSSVLLLADRFGTPNNAAGFNGGTSNLRVTNTPVLNCDSAITVALWMKPGIIPAREMFLISHGSWQNRWKISIIPEGNIRWTVKTTTGVTDLDSRTRVASGVYHHIAGTYNGSDFELYVDGELESFKSFSGRLLTPAIDLTVAQMLPTDANYNFPGVIDDIEVFNYALTYPQVQDVYHLISDVEEPFMAPNPLSTGLAGIYPNPCNPLTRIELRIKNSEHLILKMFDMLGREVATLLNEVKPPGVYTVEFDGSNLASGVYLCRLQGKDVAETRKLVLMR